MKKLIIFICLLICQCGFEKETKNTIILKDPLINAYKLDKVQIDRSKIKDNLNYFLNKYKRNWTKKEKEKCVDILYYGQQQFNINHKIILSIISVESQFNIKAIGKNKKSVDFGLCQINSRYIKQRYRNAEKYLKELNIKYTDSKFDISKNILSAYIYLRDISSYADLIEFGDYIKAYHVGIKGSQMSYMQKECNVYFDKFMKEYMEI